MMFITTRKTISIITGEVLELRGYLYYGPVSLACSSGDSTVSATESSQAALNTELSGYMKTAFAQNQSVYKMLTPLLEKQVTNPQGMTQQAMAAARTGATDTTALEFENASRNANAVAAAHGGGALPSGVAAQVSGDISASAAAQDSAEQNQITLQNATIQNQNYWNAISGLGNITAQNNPTNYANAATNAGNSVASLGQTYLASQQAGWQDAAGIISGVGALAGGAGAIGTGFKL
jgi:hypothetical protein